MNDNIIDYVVYTMDGVHWLMIIPKKENKENYSLYDIMNTTKEKERC